MMSDLVSPFKTFLKQHGYQLTSERMEIAQVVSQQRRIFTTEGLMAQLRRRAIARAVARSIVRCVC